jgi:hypothetical protein
MFHREHPIILSGVDDNPGSVPEPGLPYLSIFSGFTRPKLGH